MTYLVLMLWLIQATVGVILLIGWLRRGRGRAASAVIAHVVISLTGLACWAWFVATGALFGAWMAFAIIAVGAGFGDVMLLARAHRLAPGATTIPAKYGVAIVGIFRGRFPWRVVLHTLGAAFVIFPTLGVCIGATVAAAA